VVGAVLFGIFALQVFVGEGDSTGSYELVQLGALVPARVMVGEWWRVVGWSFLHIGFLHIFMNTYALWAIGRDLERIVGAWRFITLYTGAVLLGAVVVMLTSDAQLTAGASGGIFGLLGAEAVLVLSPRSPLPEALRVQRRAAIVMNLAANIFYSFRPGVSAAGHAGGFIAGALIAMLLPTTLEGLVDASKRPLPRVLGVLSVGVLAAGLIASLAHALPVLLSTEPVPLTVRALPSMSLHAALPTELGTPEVLDPETVRMGSLGLDRAVVALTRVPNEVPVDAAAMDAELSALLAQFQSEATRGQLVPEGMVYRDAAFVELDGRQALVAHVESTTGDVTQVMVFRPLEDAFVRVDLAYWNRFQRVYAGAAERIAASVE
jgi:rhomboid protease GluP